MFCPKRRHFKHYSYKKRLKRCRFKQHCGSSSSPGRARQGKKKIFLPPVFTDFPFKKTPTQPTLSTCWRGGSIVAAPAMSLPLFWPIKTRGAEEKKREGYKERREERIGIERREPREKKENKEKKRRKNRGRNGENRHRRHLHRCQQLRPATSTVASLLPSPPPPSSSSSSSASSSQLFTLHVNNEEAHYLMGWQRRPSLKWLGRVQPN